MCASKEESLTFDLKWILSASPKCIFQADRVAGEGTKYAGGELPKNKSKQSSMTSDVFWKNSEQVCCKNLIFAMNSSVLVLVGLSGPFFTHKRVFQNITV